MPSLSLKSTFFHYTMALGDFPRGVVVTSYLDEHQERALLSGVELKSNLDLYQ
jgi:hypothetical protein